MKNSLLNRCKCSKNNCSPKLTKASLRLKRNSAKMRIRAKHTSSKSLLSSSVWNTLNCPSKMVKANKRKRSGNPKKQAPPLILSFSIMKSVIKILQPLKLPFQIRFCSISCTTILTFRNSISTQTPGTQKIKKVETTSVQVDGDNIKLIYTRAKMRFHRAFDHSFCF